MVLHVQGAMISKSINNLMKSMALVIILTGISTAQVRFGATLGATSTNLFLEFLVEGGINRSADAKTGFILGAVLEYPLNNNLSIRSGASFTQKGAQDNVTGTTGPEIVAKSTTNLSYLTIPLLAQYKLNSSGNTLYSIGGLDIGILMSAEAKISGTLSGVTFVSDTSYSIKDDLSVTDIAFNIGVGYMMEFRNSNVYGELVYSLGLFDINSVDDDVAMKTKGLIIRVGYIF